MEYHDPALVSPATDSTPDNIVLALAEMAAGAIIFGVELNRLGNKVQNPPIDYGYREPREGYCKHGVYVGGIGIDWMCGRCESE